MRIVRKRYKALYVVLAAVGVAIVSTFTYRIVFQGRETVTADAVTEVIQVLAVWVAVWLGSRWFRTADESAEPRALWRATGRPIAGVIVGVCSLVIIGSFAANLSTYLHNPFAGATALIEVIGLSGVAAFYLQSSIRLQARSLRARAKIAASD